MRFCTECGTSLDQEASKELFCSNCGARMSDDKEAQPEMDKPVEKSTFVAPKVPTSSKPSMPRMPGMPASSNDDNAAAKPEAHADDFAKRPDTFQRGFHSYGIIMTDTRKIAKLCRSTSNDISNIIKNYAHQLSRFGHQYIMFDYDSTRYKDIGWENYVAELTKFYESQSVTPKYLFIIGGDEIIPMPVFDNRSNIDVSDYDYESDVPYSYLKSYFVEDMVWDGSIYQEEIKLNVGRLPFGTDFEKSHLTSYFNKVINALENDFKISNCFSLSAESWQDASETVLDNLSLDQKFIDFSPTVSLNDVDEIFDTSSDILYFNLHGSDAPEQPEFFGDYGYQAISPDQISNLKKYNFIITEACYGAKFIGYRTDESMLLNSINKNTLAYIGSSRIAFGACSDAIMSADIIAHSVLGALSDHYTIGQALAKAKIDNLVTVDRCDDDDEDDDYFYYDNEVYDDYSLITALEFNLYGEPTLRAYHNGVQGKMQETLNVAKKMPQKTVKEEIYNKNKNQNILDAVRAAVDLEFDKISKLIQAELYNKYQLTSDELQSISLQKTKSKEGYLYVYSKQHENIKNKKLYFINCSKSGSIKKVITTK
jgi:hypothetical protein